MKIYEKMYENFMKILWKNIVQNEIFSPKFLKIIKGKSYEIEKIFRKDIFKIMYNNNIQMYNFFNLI